MQYGRRNVPGELDILHVVDQSGVLDRTIRAQVKKVDAKDGYVVLTYENMPGGGKYVTVAPLWISFPDSKVGAPAWGRFMPQEGDLVRISFDYDDRPVIVGYDIVANKAGVADNVSGWPALNAEYENSLSSSSPDRAKFSAFIPINPGEYDFMSSGGAYIYGNNKGQLYLEGGQVSLSLANNDLRLSGRAQMFSYVAEDCSMKFGQVRRLNQSTQVEDVVSSDPNGIFKEFSVYAKTTQSAGVSVPLASLVIGNVVDSLGSIQTSPDGNEIRVLNTAHNAAGLEVYKSIVDTAGNLHVQSVAADWKTSFVNTVHTNSAKVVLASPLVKLGSDSAAQQLILGTTYRTNESILHSQIQTGITKILAGLAMATAATSAASASFGVAAAAHVVPIAGPIIGAPAIAAATASLATVAAGMAEISLGLAVMQAGLTTFESSPSIYLSNTSTTT